MNSTLQTLVDLQKVDSVILGLQRQIDEFPVLVQRLDQQLAEHEESLTELRARLTEQEKLRRPDQKVPGPIITGQNQQRIFSAPQ